MNNGNERRDAFNEQMNEWVARQGLWFQLKHAADGQSLTSRFIGLSLRGSVLLIIIALGGLVYLSKRVGSDSFREDVRLSIELTLKAEECEIGAFRKENKTVKLGYLKIKGGDKSFYHNLDAQGIRMGMGLTDSYKAIWDAKSLVIDKLEAQVKAGDSDDQSAAEAFGSLFVAHEGFKFDRIEIKDTTIGWGYSERNQGAISGSLLTGSRVNGGWRLELVGGTFDQSFLKNLVINKMVILCDPSGVSIEEADLSTSDGGGSFSYQVKVGSGAQPSVEGTIEMKNIAIDSLLSEKFAPWVQGNISAKGVISGSTNSQEGIELNLGVEFQDGNIITLRDNIPLLSTLTVVDPYNNYRKVSFTKGSFRIQTGGDVIIISELNLIAEDLVHLKGSLSVRPPTHQEIAEALDISSVNKVNEILTSNWLINSNEVKKTEATKSSSGYLSSSSEDLVNSVLRSSIFSELAVKRYDGNLIFGLKPEAFNKSEKLKIAHPVDTDTNKIWLEVPLNSRLQKLTSEQAARIYALGLKAVAE